MTATTFWLSFPCRSWTACSRRRNGRITKNITSDVARIAPAGGDAVAWPHARSRGRRATTNASMHQAVTSSTAAQVMVIAPTGVLCRLRSVRMRASTGKAVMLMAAPMNRATERNRISLIEHVGIEIERQPRAEQERRDDADVADDHGGVPAVADQLGVQLQPDQEQEEDHPDLAQRVQIRQSALRETAPPTRRGNSQSEAGWAQA